MGSDDKGKREVYIERKRKWEVMRKVRERYI
jgi:hypothetical protein